MFTIFYQYYRPYYCPITGKTLQNHADGRTGAFSVEQLHARIKGLRADGKHSFRIVADERGPIADCTLETRDFGDLTRVVIVARDGEIVGTHRHIANNPQHLITRICETRIIDPQHWWWETI